MSRKYISTAIVGDAHKSDILGVSITKPFTVTASSDGFLKLWKNDSPERSEHIDLFVDKTGLHHVSTYEDTIGEGISALLVATVAFSGSVYLYRYDREAEKLSELEDLPEELNPSRSVSFYACKFKRDVQNGRLDTFAVTTMDGRTLAFAIEADTETGKVSLVFKGTAFSNDNSFATAVDMDPEQNKLAVGHQDGNVYLYDLEHLRPMLTFESAGLETGDNSGALSTVRCVQFSPGGTLLAVARDSGPYGTVTLYDVMYGETVGSLTMPTHSTSVGVGSFAHEKWCFTLSFNDEGDLIATGGLENKIRIWNVETRESAAVLTLNRTDVSDEVLEHSSDDDDHASCCCLTFIPKGYFATEGSNDGLVAVGFDRAVRWFREAGGV